ncbi:MAG: proliferating cell nuclear antigen (pcna) [Candidatus Aenigmarchaeota archaeon]|nr:proliferating cell nuclear antigen (pcna) [Candidatus Aenigmarchaeota archaeon]
MFSAKLSDAKLFVNAISTIGELIDEGVFNITKDGINLVAADRAMVAVVDFKMASSAFDEFQVDADQKIGLNITNMLSVLKRIGADDKMSLNLQGSKLEIKLEGKSKRRFVIPLLDISQEEIPPIQQLDFPVKVEVKPQILESGIEDADVISDAVMMEALKDKFVMRAEGDVSKAELELERGNENLLNLEAASEVKSRYPLDYLKKMMKAAKIADNVTIWLGQDYPMRLEFKSGDKASLSFVLAPRVSDSE